MRSCRTCGFERPEVDFAMVRDSTTGKKKRGPICKGCWNDEISKRYRRRKAKAISLMGGKCQKCGYSRNLAAFDFHHRDPSQKDLVWGSVSRKPWPEILREIAKCDLLCANCHREEHHPEMFVDESTFVFPPCPGCGAEMIVGDDYCSPECMYHHRRKVDRPSKDGLSAMLENRSLKDIAREFGVRDSTVRSWAVRYGLMEPSTRKYRTIISS